MRRSLAREKAVGKAPRRLQRLEPAMPNSGLPMETVLCLPKPSGMPSINVYVGCNPAISHSCRCMRAPIFAGRYSDDLSKRVGKVPVAGKSASQGDVYQRDGVFAQYYLRLFQP